MNDEDLPVDDDDDAYNLVSRCQGPILQQLGE